MNKYFKAVALVALASGLFMFNSCDKVNDPVTQSTGGGNISTGTLLGTLDSITVTNSTITDDELAELKAEYIFEAGAAKIVFKWKDGVSDTLRATGSSSSVSFTNIPVLVQGGSPGGDLRFVYSCTVTQTINGDGTIFIPARPSAQLQNVLVEDFTGQKCVNCPGATRLLHGLDTLNPGRLVLIGAHAGVYADPTPGDSCFYRDFRTPTGNDLNVFFHVTDNGSPSAMIGRRTDGLNGSYVFYTNTWTSKINNELSVTAKAFVKTITSYNPDNRTVTITAGAGMFANETGDYRIAMYLTEDSIISCQYDQVPFPPLVNDYVQRHMLKDVIFGNWQGEDWATDPTDNVKRIKSYSYQLDEAINADHASIVTFIYDASNYRIMQVTEHKVIE